MVSETVLLVVAGVVAAIFVGAVLFYVWTLRRLRATNRALEEGLHREGIHARASSGAARSRSELPAVLPPLPFPSLLAMIGDCLLPSLPACQPLSALLPDASAVQSRDPHILKESPPLTLDVPRCNSQH